MGEAVVAGTCVLLWWKLTLAELSFASMSYMSTDTKIDPLHLSCRCCSETLGVPGTCLGILQGDPRQCRRWQGRCHLERKL